MDTAVNVFYTDPLTGLNMTACDDIRRKVDSCVFSLKETETTPVVHTFINVSSALGFTVYTSEFECKCVCSVCVV